MTKKSAAARAFRNKSFLTTIILACLCLAALASTEIRRVGAGGASGANSAQQQPPPASAPQARASAKATAALERLRLRATSTLTAHVSRETEQFDFVRAQGNGVLAPDQSAEAPEARALAFMREHGGVIGLSDAERQSLGGSSKTKAAGSDLKVREVSKDEIGSTHVRLDQVYKGLTVFGAQVVVHMNDQGIKSVSGHFVPDIQISTVPKLSAATAIQKAVASAPGLSAVKNELSIYRVGLLEGYKGNSVLAYAIEVTDGGALREQVWIDASKGNVLNRISLNHTGLSRKVYLQTYNPLTVVRQEGDPLTPGPTPGTTGADPINNLYVMAGQTFNFYKSGFNRDSYDGLGHIMESVLLVSTNPNIPCPNAYWNGVTTNYCPELDADDVVTHEWTHAYTQFTHGLIYSYQSGALNESWSDIFGESIDLLNGVDAEGGANNNQPGPNGQRWLIGEDVVSIGPIRNMWDPTEFGDADKVSSGNYACGSADGGGVHSNSGVPNHAFAIIVDGKNFNGVNVQGVGLTRALHIYFRAMTVYQTPTTNFALHSQAVQASCNDLIGQPLNSFSTDSENGSPSGEVITVEQCQQVANALAAVEMNSTPPCNFVPILSPNAPESCPGAVNVFVEDWETGDDGWTRTSVGVFPDWEDQTRDLRDFVVRANLPKDRAGSAAYAKNAALGERGGGSCTPGGQPEGDYSGEFTIDSPQITIPADAQNLRVRFDHYVASEATFDGGQLEVSVNGGEFQLVPQGSYEFNQPNAAFAGAPPAGNNTNPNAGEFAWNGTNTGTQEGSWGTTIADLTGVAGPGDTVRLRFKFSQDGCNGVDGWYIDNIHVYFCPDLEAPALALGADYENPDTNGSYTLTWTRPEGATGPDTVQESTVSCGPLLFDDAENGLGQWVATTTGPDPNIGWQAVTDDKPQHSGTTFRARGTNGVVFANSAALLTFNGTLTIPTTGQTFLTFSDWDMNEGEDGVFVEASTDGGTTWAAIYQNVRSAQINDGALAFATEPLFKREVNLANYGGQTIRLRFRYQTGPEDRPASAPLGWYLDDIKVENDSWIDVVTTNGTSHLVSGASNGTRCYRVRTTYTIGSQLALSPFSNIVSATVSRTSQPPSCIEDNDPSISYANGWHTVNSSNASDGHFRMSTGNDTAHGASLTFNVPAGQAGKITYYYAKSTKGGTADVYLDGVFQATINYKGSVGKLKDPEFNADYKAEYGNLSAGNHILELRMNRDGVYVDRFCMENSSSGGPAAAGPGQTSAKTSNVAPGKQSLQSFTLPVGTEGIAVVAEISPELPIQLVLIDPSGAVTTATANAAGVASINKSAQPGVYTLKAINVSAGPVQVWTATTSYLRR
jgi:Zn-dependent metalloprotease